MAKRLPELAQAVLEDPFDGIGRPEPLKNPGSDVESRRITQEHRCVIWSGPTGSNSCKAVTTAPSPWNLPPSVRPRLASGPAISPPPPR